MGSYANIWTPRHSTQVYPSSHRHIQKFTFSPTTLFTGTNASYLPPPQPLPMKRKAVEKRVDFPTADALFLRATQLREEAAECEASRQEPSLKIQLGLLLLSKDNYITKLLKDWDTRRCTLYLGLASCAC